MLYIYEFEVFKDEGFLLAFPFDFEGGTQGVDERDVAEAAADWLRTEIQFRLMNKEEIPKPTFGNKMKHGGRALVVAIETSLDNIDAVPAHKAAEMLGLSRGRITQLLSTGLLQGFRKGRDTFVTRDSVKARLKDARKAGRPRKTTDQEAKAS